jgi:catechol 2,3-dioxygenase-like lactoylglutathione lyase family enzyme
MKPLAQLFLALFFALPLCAQQGQQRPAITGIAFARFYTTDPAAADIFYGKTLGLRKIESGATSIYPVNSSQWIEVVSAAPPKPNIRMAAVAFTTRDAPALERYLTAHGIAIELPLKDGEFGVRDPEGNLVIFVQRDSQKKILHAPASPTAASARIIHVGFIVHDRAVEDPFWRTLLGFTPYWYGGRADGVIDYVSQQVPNGTDWLEYMLNGPAEPALRQAGSMDHVSLGVEHIGDAIAALARNGCTGPACTSSKTGRDGKIQLNLLDPDQTRTEFMEFKPSGTTCCSPFTGPPPTAKESR